MESTTSSQDKDNTSKWEGWLHYRDVKWSMSDPGFLRNTSQCPYARPRRGRTKAHSSCCQTVEILPRSRGQQDKCPVHQRMFEWTPTQQSGEVRGCKTTNWTVLEKHIRGKISSHKTSAQRRTHLRAKWTNHSFPEQKPITITTWQTPNNAGLILEQLGL